jgi:hypothetical protein
MRTFFAVTIAISLLFLGLTFGIAKAQVSHGFQDTKFAGEHPWLNVREHGQSMYERGKMLKEMGEKMMRDGAEGQKSPVLSQAGGIPGGPQYTIEMGKMIKETGEKMMLEGEHMIREADANIWKEGGPGGPKAAPKAAPKKQ